MSKVAASDVRRGMLLAVGDRMCRVVSWNIWKSDRRSRIQMKFKEILTGRTSEVTAQPDDRYEVLDAEMIDLSHSYRDGPDEVFYTETGEEWRIPAEGLEEVLRWVSPIYRGQVVDGKLVAITLPPTVVATIVECEPHIKGQSSGLKDAKLDNGLLLKVGTMLDVGDRAAFDSDTLEFRERAP
jgi:elongation factor P